MGCEESSAENSSTGSDARLRAQFRACWTVHLPSGYSCDTAGPRRTDSMRNMFNVGPAELLILVVVYLTVIRPKLRSAQVQAQT